MSHRFAIRWTFQHDTFKPWLVTVILDRGTARLRPAWGPKCDGVSPSKPSVSSKVKQKKTKQRFSLNPKGHTIKDPSSLQQTKETAPTQAVWPVQTRARNRQVLNVTRKFKVSICNFISITQRCLWQRIVLYSETLYSFPSSPVQYSRVQLLQRSQMVFGLFLSSLR